MSTFIFLSAAFILAFLLVIAIALVAAGATRWSGQSFRYLMSLMAVASVANIVFSGRILIAGDEGLLSSFEGGIAGHLLAKLFLAMIVGCSVALCAAWFFVLRKNVKAICRFKNRELEPSTDMVIAFMVFYFAYSIFPIFFGQQYYFHVNLIYPFFVYLALFLWLRLSSIDPVIVIKQCLCVIVFGSLIAAVFAPQLAIQSGYGGLIPGFDLRLWGVTAHANTLGSVASVLLVLEAAEPSTRAWLRTSILVASGLTLIMTQSKTSILAALLGLSIILVWHILERTQAKSGRSSTLVIGFIAITIALIAVIGTWVMFYDWGVLVSLNLSLNADALNQISTGTGRIDIWNAAIKAGLENPLFGQGVNFWNENTRLRLGLSGATDAHNLFLQVFSCAGFVGLAALLVFLYFLVQYSMRASENTRGGSIALMVVFFARGMTEVVIQPNTILTGGFFAMMAYFIYVMDRGAKPIHNTNKSASFKQIHFARAVHSK